MSQYFQPLLPPIRPIEPLYIPPAPLSDGWRPFMDKSGPNNSYPIDGKGLELHCHGKNFEGPASLKFQPDKLKDLSPGEALWLGGIMEAADRGYFREKDKE